MPGVRYDHRFTGLAQSFALGFGAQTRAEQTHIIERRQTSLQQGLRFVIFAGGVVMAFQATRHDAHFAFTPAVVLIVGAGFDTFAQTHAVGLNDQ